MSWVKPFNSVVLIIIRRVVRHPIKGTTIMTPMSNYLSEWQIEIQNFENFLSCI